MKTPIIITNFKTYQTATGDKAVELAKIHEKVALETGANIAIAVQAIDLWRVSQAVKIPVLAQHIDAAHYGSSTGHVVSEALKEAGAYGSLLNHSEFRVEHLEKIERTIIRSKEVGLYLVVCAEDPEEGKQIAALGAFLIAVEPPELIGGDISVAKAKPEIITQAVDLIGAGKVLVGAGIKTQEDVRIALKLGAVGVLLASGITKADDPEAVLRDLVEGLLR